MKCFALGNHWAGMDKWCCFCLEEPRPTLSISAKNDVADIEHREILESQPSQIDQVVLTLGDSPKVMKSKNVTWIKYIT